MTNTKIWNQILKTSLKRGFIYSNLEKVHPTSQADFLQSQYGVEDGSWRILAFDRNFASLLNYKLGELGQWVDQDKGPFDFLAEHLRKEDLK